MSAGRSLWIWHLETGAQRLSGAPSVTLGSPQVGQQQVAASVLAERRQNALVNTVGPLHLGIARDLAEQPPKRMVLNRYNSFRVRRRAKTVPLRNRFSSAGGPAIRFAGRSMSSGAAIIRAAAFQCPQGALPIMSRSAASSPPFEVIPSPHHKASQVSQATKRLVTAGDISGQVSPRTICVQEGDGGLAGSLSEVHRPTGSSTAIAKFCSTDGTTA